MIDSYDMLYMNFSDFIMCGSPVVFKLVVGKSRESDITWSAIIATDVTDSNKSYAFKVGGDDQSPTIRLNQTFLETLGNCGYISFLCYLLLRIQDVGLDAFHEIVKLDRRHAKREEFKNMCKTCFASGHKFGKHDSLVQCVDAHHKLMMSDSTNNAKLQSCSTALMNLSSKQLVYTGVVDDVVAKGFQHKARKMSVFAGDYQKTVYTAAIRTIISSVEYFDMIARTKKLYSIVEEMNSCADRLKVCDEGERDELSTKHDRLLQEAHRLKELNDSKTTAVGTISADSAAKKFMESLKNKQLTGKRLREAS